MNFTEDSIAAAKTALERLRRGYAMLCGESVELGNGDRRAGGARRRGVETRFFDALDDDMNTAGALGVLFDLISGLSKHPDAAQREGGAVLLHDALQLFGLGPLLERPRRGGAHDRARRGARRALARAARRRACISRSNGESPDAIVQAVIDARAAARKNKDFALGDRLRDALAAEGIALNDSKDGTTWTAAGA